MSKSLNKVLALVLALVMVMGLAACDNGGSAPAATEAPAQSGTETAPADSNPEAPAKKASADTPLVVGYSPFNSKFSPFFSETAYDQDVWALTSLNLIGYDRTGALIYKGIEGETVEFNGTPYTYYGPADVDVKVNDDESVDFNIKLREDLVFSDGEPLTIDDVIFSIYVYSDPTYDGSTTFYSLPIEGMKEYRSGMDSRGNAIFAAGPDGYTDSDLFTEEQYNTFWDYYNTKAGADFAQEIVDYCINNGYNAPTDSVAACAANWGFELAEDATAQDFWDAIVAAYPSVEEAEKTETAGGSRQTWTIAKLGAEYQAGVETGESAPSITGIKKTGDYSMTIHMTEIDATSVYQLVLPIAPMHYYGDAAQFDYDNNMFGFPKGDLSLVRAKTTQPMGAGPYKFLKFENGVVYFEANDKYYKGAPKTKYINFVETIADNDKLNGVITGTIDITDPTFSNENIAAIEAANGGTLDGSVVTTNTVDNLGYGYIAINAANVSVGNEPGSDASKALRKAFATIFSVYREVAIDSYYGDRASVINYPISNTSWAAPRPADDGYKVAFSTDVNGEPIYTAGMTAEEKYAAALQAALGYFEKAGYTVEDGKLTAAPEGAKLEYTFWIPADGIGDHPAFKILTESRDALATIGVNLIIKDLTNSSELWDALDAVQADMWAAAWGASLDPDMYQIYFSDVANGPSTGVGVNPYGGPAQGGDSSKYCIADEELDQLILDARRSFDQAYRKAMYKACLDIIVDWACEVPTYQRQNAIIFSTERVNIDTVTPDITTFYGWNMEIENTELN